MVAFVKRLQEQMISRHIENNIFWPISKSGTLIVEFLSSS